MDEQMVAEDEDLFSYYQISDSNLAERPVPFIGLKNLGNSCYFNSVLQVLLHSPGLKECVKLYADEASKCVAVCNHGNAKKVKYEDRSKKKCKVFCEFNALCEKMLKKQSSVITTGIGKGESSSDYAIEPKLLLESLQRVYPSFEPFAQQDAQECLQCLLDTFHDSVLMLSHDKDIDCLPSPKNELLKVLGGSKSGDVAVISKGGNRIKTASKNSQMSKATPGRKQGLRSMFNNPLRCLRESNKENTSPRQSSAPKIKQNKNVGVLDIGRKASNILTTNPVKRKASSALLEGKNEAIAPALKNVSFFRKREELQELLKVNCGYNGDHSKYVNKLPSESGRLEELDLTTDPSSRLKQGRSFVESLFQGEIVNKSRCLECENCGNKVEPFMDVSLPVCQNDELNSNAIESPEPRPDDVHGGSKCSVTWGMASFASHEMLNGENKYFCDVCKRYCEGERRLLLNRLPPLLTLHLKRFTSHVGGGDNFGVSVSKINTCFEVPSRMSLKKWCSESCNDRFEYDLFAVIVHSGTTVCSGHYLAYIKIRQYRYTLSTLNDPCLSETLQSYVGQWLEADDERVRVIPDEKFQEIILSNSNEEASRTPYLLFYCKRSNE